MTDGARVEGSQRTDTDNFHVGFVPNRWDHCKAKRAKEALALKADCLWNSGSHSTPTVIPGVRISYFQHFNFSLLQFRYYISSRGGEAIQSASHVKIRTSWGYLPFSCLFSSRSRKAKKLHLGHMVCFHVGQWVLLSCDYWWIMIQTIISCQRRFFPLLCFQQLG